MLPTKPFLLVSWILLALSLTPLKSHGQPQTGTIAGKITDPGGQALIGVNVIIPGTTRGTTTDEQGNFQLGALTAGEHTLKFTYIGYRTEVREHIPVTAGQTTQLEVSLVQEALQMQAIVVSPGSFSVSQGQTARQQIIQKQRILSMPATLDDISRVIQLMPGVSFSDDFSAHFHVRGGQQNENLILMDGMEIFDPYHLKNIGGAVGVMNLDLIEEVSILTGGFAAKYGDKLSAVVAVENRNGNPKKFHGNVGIGGTGTKLVFEGPLYRGGWLFSFRKSFLKEAVKLLNPTDYTFSPSYYDLQSKVDVRINANNQITANLLYSKDDSYLEKWHGTSDLYSDYGNQYLGLVWKSTLRPNLLSELILSDGENFWNNRLGVTESERLRLTEKVATWQFSYQPHSKHQLESGFTYKNIRYDYQFVSDSLTSEQPDYEPLILSSYGSKSINQRTYKASFFIQDQFELFKTLVLNTGVRYDYFEYNQDYQWSPRLGLAYRLRPQTIVRVAWGHYFQAPLYTELTAHKGTESNPLAQKATHYVLGIEHFFNENFNIRVEGYLKNLSRMIGRYCESFAPSGKPRLRYGNPYNGTARGIEFFMNGQLSSSLSIWLAYAYSKTRLEASIINWEERTIERRLINRFTDQPHNLALYVTVKLPKAWELNLKWRYLSGTPFTPRVAEWNSAGNPIWLWKSENVYAARYPAYHRLDVRLGKNWLFSRFKLALFLEIKNLYNQQNVLLYNYQIKQKQHHRETYYTLPILPSLEFTLHF